MKGNDLSKRCEGVSSAVACVPGGRDGMVFGYIIMPAHVIRLTTQTAVCWISWTIVQLMGMLEARRKGSDRGYSVQVAMTAGQSR
jgi:hypothetical protein